MYNEQEVAVRIKMEAKKKKISINKLLTNCNMGKNTIAKMANGTDILTQNFGKIAENLGCSADYLLGRTDTSILVNLPDELLREIIDEYNEKKDDFIDEKELDEIVKPPIIGRNYYLIEFKMYGKVIEIYDKASTFDSNKLKTIIESKEAFEALFKYKKGIGAGKNTEGIYPTYELSKSDYNIFKQVYKLYKRSFISTAFRSKN